MPRVTRPCGLCSSPITPWQTFGWVTVPTGWVFFHTHHPVDTVQRLRERLRLSNAA